MTLPVPGKVDIAEFCAQLVCRDGIWFSQEHSAVSYPEDGNTTFAQIEDQSFWYRHRNECILAAIRNFAPAGVLLDIGGGNGYVAAAIQASGVATALLEPDVAGVLQARRRGVEHLICASFADAQLRENSLAGIGLFDVLEHIEDDAAMLDRIHQVLAPNGRLYMTVPAYQFLWSTEDDHDGHFRRYTLGGLTTLLRQSGFEVEYASYFFSFLPLPIFMLRTLPSKLTLNSAARLDRYAESRDVQTVMREHTPGNRISGALLERACSREAARIGHGKTLPIGGSCLVVACNSTRA